MFIAFFHVLVTLKIIKSLYRKGKKSAIIGRSGAGKTSIEKVITKMSLSCRQVASSNNAGGFRIICIRKRNLPFICIGR